MIHIIGLEFWYSYDSTSFDTKSICYKIRDRLWLLTDRNAWMRSAFTDANGFPLTRTVKVSSFSDVIRLPNHDFLVNSGDDSGVRPTSSDDAKEKTNKINILWS